MFITFKNKLFKFFIIIFSISVFSTDLIASVGLVLYEDFHLKREQLFLENSNFKQNLSSENLFLRAYAQLYRLKDFRDDIYEFLKTTEKKIEKKASYRDLENQKNYDDIIKEVSDKKLGKYYTNNATIGFANVEISFQQFFIDLYIEEKEFNNKILFLCDDYYNVFIDVPENYQIKNVDFLTYYADKKQYLFFRNENHFSDFIENLNYQNFSVDCIFVEFFNKTIEIQQDFMQKIPNASIIGWQKPSTGFPTNQFFIVNKENHVCPLAHHVIEKMVLQQYNFGKEMQLLNNKNNNYHVLFENIKRYNSSCSYINFFYYVVKHDLVHERFLDSYINFVIKKGSSFQVPFLYYLLKHKKESFGIFIENAFYDDNEKILFLKHF